jgi:hypothetical protein
VSEVQMAHGFSPKKSKEMHTILNNPGYLYNMKGKVLRSKKVSSSQVYTLFNRKNLHTVNIRVLLLFGQIIKVLNTLNT